MVIIRSIIIIFMIIVIVVRLLMVYIKLFAHRISTRSAKAPCFFALPLTLSFCLARVDLFSHSVTVALGASSNTTVFAANHNYCSILPAAKSSADTEQLTRTDTHTYTCTRLYTKL